MILHFIHVCKLPCLSSVNSALAHPVVVLTQVNLVPDQYHWNLFIALALASDLVDPIAHVKKRLLICQVEVQDHTIC